MVQPPFGGTCDTERVWEDRTTKRCHSAVTSVCAGQVASRDRVTGVTPATPPSTVTRRSDGRLNQRRHPRLAPPRARRVIWHERGLRVMRKRLRPQSQCGVTVALVLWGTRVPPSPALEVRRTEDRSVNLPTMRCMFTRTTTRTRSRYCGLGTGWWVHNQRAITMRVPLATQGLARHRLARDLHC
jgi:hypothetical protein